MPKYTERAPGVYRAKFVKLDTDFKMTDRDSGEEVTRWRWVFQELTDPTTMGELDTITSPGFRARSNGLKLFAGMLGRPPTEGDDTDTLIGQDFDVVYGPNQAGRYTVTGATRPAGNPTPVAALSAAHQDSPGDLPF